MDDQQIDVVSYFQATQNYFWKWAEDGRVIEHANGRTICYYEDLVYILNELQLQEPIPLTCILLLLCACKDNYQTLYDIDAPIPSPQHITQLPPRILTDFQSARLFLHMVNSLPFEYRSGLNRIALLQAVFDGRDLGVEGVMRTIFQEFSSGNRDEEIYNQFRPFRFNNVIEDLEPLLKAYGRYPDKDTLELKLRTGLTQLPVPVSTPITEDLPTDLLGQLAHDSKTAGISRLARKIIGALNIPMHLSGSSDQSVGGVSDISNRGHYDKLLLSELAQDDMLLTARLANNEALFLQREELPVNQVQPWCILVDTTLKMWGQPRVFALACGLAFSESKTKNETVRAFALGSKQNEAIDLETKEGVINFSERLDPGLNCGKQLQHFITHDKTVKEKYIFITGDHYRHDADFLAQYTPVKDQLDYLVVVSRTGEIQLLETRDGKHKMVNRALIDLDETLFAKKQQADRKQMISGLPAWMSANNQSLYYPSSKIKLNYKNTYQFKNKGIASITLDKRLLYWPDKDTGAIELIDHLPGEESYFGDDLQGNLFLLMRQKNDDHGKIYHVNLENYALHISEARVSAFGGIKFIGECFFIINGNQLMIINAFTGKQMDVPDAQEIFNKHVNVIPYYKNFNQIKKAINNGYSVINSANNIYLHHAGILFIDKRGFFCSHHDNSQFLIQEKLSVPGEMAPSLKQEIMKVPHLPNIKFTKFIWESGSEMILDSRGLLHLKSADKSLPEVSILLVVDQPTACWCEDGAVSGSSYFIRDNPNGMKPSNFYNDYILPILKGIL